MTPEIILFSSIIAFVVTIATNYIDKRWFSYQFEKRMADFNFFNKKKFEVYPKLHNKITLADSRIKSLRDISHTRDFISSGDNAKDILDYMTLRKFPNGKIEEILKTWQEDKRRASDEIHSYERVFNEGDARKCFSDANNYYWFSILYLSDSIKDKARILLKNLHSLLIDYENGLQGIGKEELGKQRDLKQETDKQLEELITELRKEIQPK